LGNEIQRGEISLDEGEALLGNNRSSDSRDVSGVPALAEALRKDARRDSAGTRRVARLLVAAFDGAVPTSGEEVPWIEAALTWVDVVGRHLEVVPDARDLFDAASRIERLRAWATQQGDKQTLARADYLLASAYLRPYRSRTGVGYADLTPLSTSTRLSLSMDELTAMKFLSYGSIAYRTNPFVLPPWFEIAPKAEALLREALRYAHTTLKAEAQLDLLRLLGSISAVGGKKVPESLRIEARAQPTSSARLEAWALGRRNGQAWPASELAGLAAAASRDLDQDVLSRGPNDTLRSILEALSDIASADGGAAVHLARRLANLAGASVSDSLREDAWSRQIAARSALGRPRSASTQELIYALGQLLAAADYERALVSVEQMIENSVLRDDADVEALRWLSTNLGMEISVAAPFSRKVQLMRDLLVRQLDLGMRERPLSMMLSMLSDLRRGEVGELTELAELLERAVLPLEKALGEGGRQVIRETTVQLLKYTGDARSLEPLLRISQVANGARFSSCLTQGVRLDAAGDPEVAVLLRRLSQLEADEPQESIASSARDFFFGDLAVSSFSSTSEMRLGSTVKTRISNIRLKVDQLIDERLVSILEPGSPPVVGADEILTAIGKDSAILITHIGRQNPPTGDALIFTQLMSRAQWYGSWMVQEGTSGDTTFLRDPEGTTLLVPALGTKIAQTRQFVSEYSKPDAVSRDAETYFNLAGTVANWFGPTIAEGLQRLHEDGVRHLCIVPYGPLRAAPLHLLGGENGCLADDWVVTYLPSIAALLHPQPSPRAAMSMSSFGLSYQRVGLEDAGHSSVDTAGQAKEIAGFFGQAPVLDGEVTKTRVLGALRTSRYVHIATHGEMDARAPSFQSLQLVPEGSDDGRLRAYELLPEDLRHVELVTLSACESALGRFDMGDNPKGLPACMFIAGVRTMVGTLWPVNAAAAATFFATLYRRLSDGSALLEAFAVAQQKTRRHYCEYKEWGAFYLLGDWRQREIVDGAESNGPT
jgi:CHAT domain-containing protein